MPKRIKQVVGWGVVTGITLSVAKQALRFLPKHPKKIKLKGGRR